MSCINSIEARVFPQSLDWIDMFPSCPRGISRIVDLENQVDETLAAFLKKEAK